MHLLTRRATLETLALSVLAGLELGKAARADEKFVTIGMDFSLTGSDADSSARARDGALMAIDDANANGGPGGYKLRVMVLDDGTTTAGQYDPAQAAINARKMVADPTIVAAVGPQSSTPGKAMSAILSLGNLATITPSSTNPDITDPKFAQLYRPKGLPIYFRMVTTDAYQGPNMANFFADVLKVKSIYGLDDSGAFGVGVSAAFEDQARKRGIKVLGHDRLDPKAADYSAVITKIRSLGPEGLYYGGDSQAGIKVAKQSYEALPNVIKAGADGTFGPSMLEGAGFPAIEGWYATIPAPHALEAAVVQPWVQRFVKRTGNYPMDYSITCYDAVMVITDAIKRVTESGKPVTRVTVRDAIQTTKLDTLQGEISFDANGDLNQRVVSVFQVRHDPKYPPGDILHQYKYIGVALAQGS